jgi:hypothetical protein
MPKMSQQNRNDKTVEPRSKWENMKIIYNIVVPYFQWTFVITKVYILWVIIHYVSVQLYVKYCVPSSIWGFIISPLLISSPHCKAMRWVLHVGADKIDAMWNSIGVWFSEKLLQIN